MAERRLLYESRDNAGEQTEVTFRLYETPPVPEVFIDGMQGFSRTNEIVKINCFTRGMGPAALPGMVEERDATLRLVMSYDTFESLVGWMSRLVADMKKMQEDAEK